MTISFCAVSYTHLLSDGAVAGMTLVGPAILAAQKVIVDGDLVRAESEIKDFVGDEIVAVSYTHLWPSPEGTLRSSPRTLPG